MNPRIVSLLPSSTEIVHALGFGESLVGRSHECDHPPGVEALPPLTAPKYATDGTSYQVDERVRALVQEGLGVYRVDADRLRELRPGVILTQTQCDVCAASLGDVEEALAGWLGQRPVLVPLAPSRLSDVWDDIRRVAAALGRPERGERVVRALEERVDAVAARVRAVARRRPRVACVEWLDPLMTAGNWVPELVELAGGEPLLSSPGEHSPWVAWEALRESDPDVVLVMPCGFSMDRSRAERDALEGLPGWSRLTAVRSGRVYLADGHHYFNRPGPRLVESLEILAEVLHPELPPSHLGTGWEPLGP